MFGVRRSSPTFIQKEKKKVHKKPLTVKTYFVGRVQPHSEELFEASRAKLLGLAMADKERMMLEEAKNKVESYIYKIKNMLSDHEEEVAAVSTEKQRDEAKALAESAEEWLYEDGYSANLATMEDKYAELSTPFEKILLRMIEVTARPKAVDLLGKKLTEIEALMMKWKESKPQVTEEEQMSVLQLVEVTRKWLEDNEKAQSKKKAHEEPAFESSEIPFQLQPIETLVARLNRKPLPKVDKKNETITVNVTDANQTMNATNTSDNTTNTTSNATKEADATSTIDDSEDSKSDEATVGSEDETAETKENVEDEL